MALKLKITIDNRVVEKIMLNARKTIDGNIIIRDHPDIDIFILSGTNKIVAMPKEQLDDEVHDAQQRLFKYLLLRGVIDINSIQGGNTFMSMEATIPPADVGDPIQFVLYSISNFCDEEQPFYDDLEEFEKEMERQLLEPEPDEHTEFDAEKYHSDVKGSLPPKYASYGINSIYKVM